MNASFKFAANIHASVGRYLGTTTLFADSWIKGFRIAIPEKAANGFLTPFFGHGLTNTLTENGSHRGCLTTLGQAANVFTFIC